MKTKTRYERERGVTLVEYALLLALIALACITGFGLLTRGTEAVADRMATAIGPPEDHVAPVMAAGDRGEAAPAELNTAPLNVLGDERCKVSIVPMVARNAADWNEWISAYEEAQDLHCDIAHSYMHWADIELDNGVFDWDSPGYYVSLAKGHGMEVSQEITVINVMDIGNLPADLAGRGLDDATLQQRFLSFVEQYAEHFKDDVSYLWLGNEIDTYLHYNPDKVPTFVNLLTQAVAIVREHAPEMKVGTVMTYHGAVMTGRTGWIHTFGPLVDIMAVTFYPQHMPGRYDEATIDQQFDDIVATYGDYPLALVESAVSAEAVYGGGEDKQVSYCRALFRAMRRHKDVFDFAGWFNLHDFDPAYLEMLFGGWGISDPDVLAWNGSLALSSFQDEEKPVHAVWAEEAGGSVAPPDNQAPTVAWVSPADGAAVSGQVALSIQASDAEDETAALTVECRIDGGAWQGAAYSAGSGRFEYTWDSTAVGDGDHALDARATDTQSGTATASIEVVADNADEPPAVAWSNPAGGAGVAGWVTFRVDATDAEDAAGALTVVCRVDDGGWLAATYNAATGRYERGLNTETLADGEHALSARATDSGSHTVTVGITVTVDNVDEPPAVVWSNPADGATVAGQVTLRISATDAEDGAGDLSVACRVDGGAWQNAAYNAATQRYECAWDTDGLAAGDHALEARATDSEGNTVAATITVNTEGAPDQAPTVAWANPADGATIAGRITLQMSAVDDADPMGTLTVQWRVDGSAWQPTAYNAETGRYEATADTTGVADGDYALQAQATDSAGNTSALGSLNVTVRNQPADPEKMYVSDISFRQVGQRLITTVTIRRDSNANGVADPDDAVVEAARVELKYTFDEDADGVFEPDGDDGYVVLDRETKTNGTAKVSFRRVPRGDYRIDVTSLTHDAYTHEAPLDVDNPAYYTMDY